MKGLFCFKIKPSVLRASLLPVRDRVDAVIYILNLSKLMLITQCFQREAMESDDTVVLKVGSQSRVYVREGTSIISVAFPFLIETDSESNFVNLYGSEETTLSNKTISQLQGMINSLRESGFDGFTDHAMALDFVEDGRSDLEHEVWPFFRAILFLDDGYIRYDHDKERANGAVHPEHHIDAFYSNRASIKLGLYSGISVADFQNIVHSSPGCHYLKPLENP